MVLDRCLPSVASRGRRNLRRHLLRAVGLAVGVDLDNGGLTDAAAPTEEGGDADDEERGTNAIADAHGGAKGGVLEALGLVDASRFADALGRRHDDGLAGAVTHVHQGEALPVVRARHGAEADERGRHHVHRHIHPTVLAERALRLKTAERGDNVDLYVHVVLEEERYRVIPHAPQACGHPRHVDRDVGLNGGIPVSVQRRRGDLGEGAHARPVLSNEDATWLGALDCDAVWVRIVALGRLDQSQIAAGNRSSQLVPARRQEGAHYVLVHGGEPHVNARSPNAHNEESDAEDER
mmetsp:Transcript_24006/g.69067  ORF Transcript_24006/g.69067 Transcript_24006/m.69067 type:complete len:294 (-) Transcript_24006:109-990(-)